MESQISEHPEPQAVGEESQTASRNILDLPSATSIVFLLILYTSLRIVTPYPGMGLGSLTGWGMLAFVVASSLYLHLTQPARWFKKYKMIPLGAGQEKLLQMVSELAETLKLTSVPTVLTTEEPNLPVQTFSTFTRQYIVINQKEIQASLDSSDADQPYSLLKPILIHEMAHLQNGDTWKFQLTKKIITVLLVYSCLIILASFSNTYSIERLLLGSPEDTLDYLLDISFFFIFMMTLIYMLKVMGQVREFYADAHAERVLGQNELKKSLIWSSSLWTPTEKRSPLGGFITRGLRTVGLAFLADKDFQIGRLLALQSGASFSNTMHQVLLAGGLAAGLAAFGLLDGGLERFSLGLWLGGCTLGILYLLPYFLTGIEEKSMTRQIFLAVFYYSLGAIILLFFYMTSSLLLGRAMEIPFSRIVRYTGGLAILIGMVIETSIVLFVALSSIISTFSRWGKIISSMSFGKPNYILSVILITQALSVCVVLDNLLNNLHRLMVEMGFEFTPIQAIACLFALLFIASPYIFPWFRSRFQTATRS